MVMFLVPFNFVGQSLEKKVERSSVRSLFLECSAVLDLSPFPRSSLVVFVLYMTFSPSKYFTTSSRVWCIDSKLVLIIDSNYAIGKLNESKIQSLLSAWMHIGYYSILNPSISKASIKEFFCFAVAYPFKFFR